MKNDFIHKKIEDVLGSIDGIQKAEANPFLFTRLEAQRNDERSLYGKITSFITKPAIAFACVCLVLIINVMVIFFSNKSYSNASTQQGSELAMADEYNQVSTPAYDFENFKP